MTQPLDPNDAPTGYVAALQPTRIKTACEGCALEVGWPLQARTCRASRCAPHERADGVNVIFILKESPK